MLQDYQSVSDHFTKLRSKGLRQQCPYSLLMFNTGIRGNVACYLSSAFVGKGNKFHLNCKLEMDLIYQTFEYSLCTMWPMS